MSGFIVGLFLLALTVRGDIPVHCVQAKTIGLWRFHIGSMGADGNCGFSAPDPPDGHHALTPPVRDPTKKEFGEYWLTSDFKESFTIDVAMKDWTAQVIKAPKDQSKLGNIQGEWTMVYDEGFHVSMAAPQGGEDHSFFAFMKYAIAEKDKADATTTDTAVATKHSVCDMTLLGWYKTLDASSKAVKSEQCFWGERVSDLKAVPASAFPPPALPVPMDVGKDANLRQKGDQKGEQSSGLFPGGVPWKGLLQFVFCLSAASTVFSSAMTIQNVCYPAGVKQNRAGCLQSRPVSIFVLLLGLIITGVTGFLLIRQGNPSVIPSPPSKKLTVQEMAERTRAGLRDAQLNGHPVRWQSDPAKLKEWVRERKEKHGIDVSEASEAQKLIDAFSPALSVNVPGFGTSETLGPVRAKAIEEQKSIAKELGKDPKDLATDDISHFGSGKHNHHSNRAFMLNGQALGPDDWKTLQNFDWRQVSLSYNGEELKGFVNAVPDQGNCGSCYATGATSMLTSRLILKYPELKKHWDTKQGKDRISVNQHLRCNPYVQGCDGGYPYLINKWGMENDLYTDRCFETANENTRTGQCPSLDGPECTNYRFRVMNYRYVGGAFGRCGMYHLCEAAIREELYKGGPLVGSIEPNKRFWGYTGGILHEVPVFLDGMLKEIHTGQDVEDCKTTECFIWRKVDHSTLLVAWGEDTSQGLTCQPVSPKSAETDHSQEPPCKQAKSEAACLKVGKACKWQGFQYWVTQNSYGNKWGNDGYMYVGPRGWDPIRIEAMAVAADIEWIREGVGESSSLMHAVSSALMANHSSPRIRKHGITTGAASISRSTSQ